MKYFIYLEKFVDPKTKEKTVSRWYYRKKVKSPREELTYVGEADLTDDYFIINCETHYTNIVDLSDVSLCFRAKLKDNKFYNFEYTLEEMLLRAKRGDLCYLSFDGFKVTNQPVLKINGKKHSVYEKNDFKLEIR